MASSKPYQSSLKNMWPLISPPRRALVSKIFDFIYKIDEMSLKKKKSININLIKEILGE